MTITLLPTSDGFFWKNVYSPQYQWPTFKYKWWICSSMGSSVVGLLFVYTPSLTIIKSLIIKFNVFIKDLDPSLSTWRCFQSKAILFPLFCPYFVSVCPFVHTHTDTFSHVSSLPGNVASLHLSFSHLHIVTLLLYTCFYDSDIILLL